MFSAEILLVILLSIILSINVLEVLVIRDGILLWDKKSLSILCQ